MAPAPDNSDPRDYILDLSTNPTPAQPTPPIENRKSKIENKIDFLSIHFRCCHVYAPIYKNAAGTAYSGHCPRCHRPAEIAISPTGSPARIFEAG
ncbi:MAG TPA: hypothetical protein VM008_22625 [Phycisphaerae bacterium]|nr:hypothetical protein [Phycisphaerae bacterium]